MKQLTEKQIRIRKRKADKARANADSGLGRQSGDHALDRLHSQAIGARMLGKQTRKRKLKGQAARKARKAKAK